MGRWRATRPRRGKLEGPSNYVGAYCAGRLDGAPGNRNWHTELLQSTPEATDPDVAAQRALFKALVVTVSHFFGSFAQLFGSLTDRRDPARLTYPLWTLMAAGVLMFLLRLGARR